MNGLEQQTPAMGQVSAQIATTPAAPTVAARLAEAENKLSNLYDMLGRAERVFTNLIAQNAEIRDQMGMTPLPPDYFA